MNIPSPVNYLCAVTELSILIVKRKPDRYVWISSILNPFMKYFTPSQACPDVQRASSSLVKRYFLQGSCVADSVSVSLVKPCVLSGTITVDAISSEHRIEAQKQTNKQKKQLHKIFDPPPQKIFCFASRAGCYMSVMRMCEEVDENLISQNELAFMHAELCPINSYTDAVGLEIFFFLFSLNCHLSQKLLFDRPKQLHCESEPESGSTEMNRRLISSHL